MAIPQPLTCGHCGATDLGIATRFSYAWISAPGKRNTRTLQRHTLCRPNQIGRMDCFRLVTVFKHAIACRACRSAFPIAGPPDARERRD